MNQDLPLTSAQRKVLERFEEHARSGKPPPTLRELCQAFGWRSTGTARDHIRALVRKGLLKPAGGRARGTTLAQPPASAAELPLVGGIPAGAPAVRAEIAGERIPVPQAMVRRRGSFLLRVRGDSMEGAGILDGDLVVVAPEPTPPAGAIVAVTLDGETTLKRLRRKGRGWILEAENPRYPPIPTETPDAYVHGVVTGVLRVLDRKPRAALPQHARRRASRGPRRSTA